MWKSLDKKKKPMTTKRFLTLVLPITLVLISAQVVSQEQITRIEGLLYLDHSPVSIEIREGKIFEITRLKEVPENFPQVYIAPGFIDNQVNGYAGVSFAFGGSDLTTDGVLLATQALWKEGVTTYLPTLTTNDRSLLTRNFSVLKKAKDDPGMLGSIPGFHLEGPFISPEDGWRGAHPLQHVRKPDWEEFMDYYNASGEKYSASYPSA
jgi:N-acetylglucosamine-6-phosphate deacetylase